MKSKIIYEDKAVLVIWKPAGLATQTANVGQADVVSELKNYLAKEKTGEKQGGHPYLGIIHRLDQPVEGLLVFAKSKNAAAALTAQLADSKGGTLNKQYYAVVCGKPEKETGDLVDYMYKSQRGQAVIAEQEAAGETEKNSRKTETAKRAVLHYRRLALVQTASGKTLSLLDITIDTGRFHQIRAQLAHAGMCILGDVKYGDEDAIALSRELQVRHAALCAYSLAFQNPLGGQLSSFRIQPENSAFSHFQTYLSQQHK